MSQGTFYHIHDNQYVWIYIHIVFIFFILPKYIRGVTINGNWTLIKELKVEILKFEVKITFNVQAT